jgi:hypothetical protein
LSQDPGWRPVPPNHLVVIRRDRSVAIRPCAGAAVRRQAELEHAAVLV